MQINLIKNLEQIITAFDKIAKLPKTLLKYGCILFLILLTIGSIMILLNNTVLGFNTYLDLISKSLIKVSFSIAAEVILGSLIIDYVFKK